MKKMLLIGYPRMNLGDDLFLSMIINRYKNVKIDLHVSKGYQYPFVKAKNVNILRSSIDDIKVEDYCLATYVAGSIFSETSKNYEYKEWLKNFVLRFKKNNVPFFFISSNYGPCYTKKWYNLCDQIIKNSYHVNLRDKFSSDNFKYEHVEYVPDLVLSLGYKGKKKIKDSVGISVIDLYTVYRNDINKNYFDYMNFLVKNIINYINQGKMIYLFSFCKYEDDETAIKDLMKLIDERYYKNIRVINYNGNINKFLNTYSRMEYMLCTRFHSMILSHIFGQKVYVCGYSDKLFNVIKSYKFKYNYIKIDDSIKNRIVDLNKYKISDIILVQESRRNFDLMDKLLEDYGEFNNDYGVGNFYEISIKKKIKKFIAVCVKTLGIKKQLVFIKNKLLKKKSKKNKIVNIEKENINLLNVCKKLDYIDDSVYQNSLKRLGYNYKEIVKREIVDGPLVSFVIPTYKRDEYLFECVDSILEQNYKNIEIIIIDDYVESSLEPKIKKKYGKYKNIIYRKNKVNSKAGISRRNGYNLANGKYVVFCDDDDFYVDYKFVSKCIKIMEKDSTINLVGFNNFTFRQYENSISCKRYGYNGKCAALDYITSFQIRYFKPFPSCAMFRKSVLDKYDFKNMKMMNDSSIFLNAMQEDNIYISREIVMFYRIHSANITNSLDAQFIIDNLAEKEKVYLNLKNNNKIPNVDEWWYQQIMFTVKYFISGSKPNKEEYNKLNNWVLKHLNYNRKKYIRTVKNLYTNNMK